MSFDIAKLHHLMFLSREFSPAARLLAVLFNRFEPTAIQLELNHSQPAATHSLHV